MGQKFDREAPQFIADLIHDFKLPDWQAAAFPGNGGGESRGFEDIVEDGAIAKGWKGGTGYFQWTGVTRNNPRRAQFEAWIRRMSKFGYRCDNYLGNYSFLYRELKGSEGARVLPKLRACQAIDQAVQIVCLVYERPNAKAAKASMATRIRYAKRALALYRENPPLPTVWPTQKPPPIIKPEEKTEMAQNLPSAKAPLNSRTILSGIATIGFTWLAARGFELDPATRELITAGVASVGSLIMMYFHARQSAPVQGSPLARDIADAKQSAEEGIWEFPEHLTDNPVAAQQVTDIMDAFRKAPTEQIIQYGPEILAFLLKLFGNNPSVEAFVRQLPRLPEDKRD
jgi:hypothetical protein